MNVVSGKLTLLVHLTGLRGDCELEMHVYDLYFMLNSSVSRRFVRLVCRSICKKLFCGASAS